jgi:hypothetical protein
MALEPRTFCYPDRCPELEGTLNFRFASECIITDTNITIDMLLQFS